MLWWACGVMLLLVGLGRADIPVAGAVASGLTVVPPGPVSDQIEVEVRVGLRNPGETTQTVRVSIFGDTRRLLARTVTVPAGGSRLVSVWWPTADRPTAGRPTAGRPTAGRPTAGHVGEHVLRYRVQQDEGVVAEGRWPLRVVSSDTPALPMLQAGWLDLLGLLRSVYPRNRDATEEDLRDVVDAMHRLSMDTIIITYVEFQGHFFYPSKLRFFDRDLRKEAAGQWLSYDALEAILSQADRNGMHVLLGLGRGGDMMLFGGAGVKDPERCRQSIQISQQVALELWGRYHHHPSFYGWYLTHEVNDLATASAYYDPVADFCHAFAPDKPVLCAPDGSPIADSEALRRSQVDIFAYQDAVGTGYVPYEYTYDPERRLAVLDQVYADYERRHRGTRKHLWSDLEIWEMAGPRYENAYPPPWSRVARQLAIESRHVEMVTAYDFLGFMEAPGSYLRLEDRRAEGLYRDYEAYLAGIRRKLGL